MTLEKQLFIFLPLFEISKPAMLKRTLHIIVAAVLVLNLTGAIALSFAGDCGMECCRPAEGTMTGAASLEAPSCCSANDVTCSFEGHRYQELFDEALCCHTDTRKVSGDWRMNVASDLLPSVPVLLFSLSVHSTGSPPSVPVYLSNATLIC